MYSSDFICLNMPLWAFHSSFSKRLTETRAPKKHASASKTTFFQLGKLHPKHGQVWHELHSPWTTMELRISELTRQGDDGCGGISGPSLFVLHHEPGAGYVRPKWTSSYWGKSRVSLKISHIRGEDVAIKMTLEHVVNILALYLNIKKRVHTSPPISM